MTNEELDRRLRSEGIVTMAATEWEELAEGFEEVERHATFLAGDLVIARGSAGPVAVEQPSSGERVVRRLADDEVRRFVQDRLDTYERMWDGCGCKVEYYR
jgi:hypothetical protein